MSINHGIEVGEPVDQRGVLAELLVECIGEVVCGVGGDEQHALSHLGQLDGDAAAAQCGEGPVGYSQADLLVVLPTPPLPPTKIHLSVCWSSRFWMVPGRMSPAVSCAAMLLSLPCISVTGTLCASYEQQWLPVSTRHRQRTFGNNDLRRNNFPGAFQDRRLLTARPSVAPVLSCRVSFVLSVVNVLSLTCISGADWCSFPYPTCLIRACR